MVFKGIKMYTEPVSTKVLITRAKLRLYRNNAIFI